MCTSTRARNSKGSAVSVPDVGPSDWSERYVTAFVVRVVRESLQGNGIPGTIARERGREGTIVLGDPKPVWL